MPSDVQVVAVGAACVDEYYAAGRWISLGDKLEVRALTPVVGGMVANVACILSQLGVRAGLVDTVNRSETTGRILQDLTSYGVDTAHMRRDESLPDGKCMIFLTGGERTVFAVRAEKPPLDWQQDLSYFLEADYLYSTVSDLAQVARLPDFLDRLREGGTQLVLDVEQYAPGAVQDLLFSRAGVLFFNEYGAAQYEDACGWKEAFRSLLEQAARVVVVTRGAKGCSVYTRDLTRHLPACSVPVTDTTGAGDTFNAAFLSRLCRGEDCVTAARFATAAAALCVMRYGAKGPGLCEAEVLRLLETEERREKGDA